MNKADYVKYWATTASKDWEAASHLFEKRRLFAQLIFCSFGFGKLLKAHFVKDNTVDFPPKTHNLLLLSSQTKLLPSVDQLRLLSQMNQFQLDARYPDYKLNMFKIATESYTQALLDEIEKVKQWLENSL